MRSISASNMVVYSIIVCSLLALTVQAHATELVPNYHADEGDSIDEMVHQLANKLLERTEKTAKRFQLSHADFDATTLEKPAHLALLSSSQGVNHLGVALSTMSSNSRPMHFLWLKPFPSTSSRFRPYFKIPPLAALEGEIDGKAEAEKRRMGRRDTLFKGAACVCGGALSHTGSANADLVPLSQDDVCIHCGGTGVAACDMCGGSGKWKATNRKRAKDRYMYTECPQCFGKGTLVCGFCFGSGLGATSVKGLLRRPEAQKMIAKMQNGQLEPGEGKQLIRQAQEELSQGQPVT